MSVLLCLCYCVCVIVFLWLYLCLCIFVCTGLASVQTAGPCCVVCRPAAAACSLRLAAGTEGAASSPVDHRTFLRQLSNVFVWFVKSICPNCQMYFQSPPSSRTRGSWWAPCRRSYFPQTPTLTNQPLHTIATITLYTFHHLFLIIALGIRFLSWIDIDLFQRERELRRGWEWMFCVAGEGMGLCLDFLASLILSSSKQGHQRMR